MSLQTLHAEALRDLVRLHDTPNFVVIGAAALACHLPMPWRWSRTEDLDLSVAIDVADLPGVLTRLPGWSVNPRLPHRWQAANGLKVDIIPAGPRHLAEGRIVWPGSGAIMNLAGMDLAFRHGIEMGLGAYAGARPVRMAA